MKPFTFRRDRLAVLALSFTLAAASHGFGQDVRVETQQQARTRAQNTLPDQEPTEAVADPELGEINLVSRTPRPKMFTFATAQNFNFTDNAFLVRDGTQSDLFWNGRLGAAFVPYATRDFTPRLIFEQNWFRYQEFGILDFDSQSLTLDLKYDLNPNDTWYVDTSYSVSRLYSPRDDSVGEFYRYGFLNASVTHIVQLQTAPVTFWFTGGTYWRHGDPSSSDRVSGYLNASATYNLTDTVQVSGFTRPEVQHYTHDPLGDRDDFNVTVGATISWSPNQYFALAATASYVGNFSSVGVRDYNVVTPSFVVAGQVAF